MDRTEISRRVHGFERWHYAMDLGGMKTPIDDPRQQVRHTRSGERIAVE